MQQYEIRPQYSPQDSSDLITSYQVIARACVQLSRSWGGTKFYFDSAGVPGDAHPNIIKCRGIVSRYTPFVIGTRRQSSETKMPGYVFIEQAEWRTWIARPHETRIDDGEAVPLIAGKNLETKAQQETTMAKNAVLRITPGGLLQFYLKGKFAPSFVPFACREFKGRLDSQLNLEEDYYDHAENKVLYRTNLAEQVKRTLGYTITCVRTEMEANGGNYNKTLG